MTDFERIAIMEMGLILTVCVAIFVSLNLKRL